MSSGIGVVASFQRKLADGRAYDHLIPPADYRDTTVRKSADLQDTLKLMQRVIRDTLEDTARLAPLLKGRTLDESCRKVWDFVYHHIQYKLDEEGIEQIRRPRRAWADRKTGVDCDCYSVFVSSVLHHLHIPHALRITKYRDRNGDPKPYYQHVYVVVPDRKAASGYRTIDPVLDAYDEEKPFYAHKDYPMELAYLSGLEGSSTEDMRALLLGIDYPEPGSLLGTTDELDALYKYLVRTRNVLRDNPEQVKYLVNPAEYVKMLDYALQYWYTPKRDEALAVLAAQEAKFSHPALRGLGEAWTPDDRSLLGYTDDEALGGLFKSIGKAVKNVAQKVGTTVKKVGQGVVTFVKNPLHALNKVNPATILARNGYLLYLKTVGKKQAQKLKWGYLTDEQARAKRFRMDDVNRWRATIRKVEDIYDKVGGEKSKLRETILQAGGGLGYPGQFAVDNSVQGLGEPATGAMLAAASAMVTAVATLLKELKDRPATEQEAVAPDTLQAQAAFLPSAEMALTTAVQPYTPAINYENPTTTNQSSNAQTMSETSSNLPATTSPNLMTRVLDFLKKNWLLVLVGGGAAVLLFSKKARRVVGLGAPPKRKTKRKPPQVLTGTPAQASKPKRKKPRKPRTMTFK